MQGALQPASLSLDHIPFGKEVDDKEFFDEEVDHALIFTTEHHIAPVEDRRNPRKVDSILLPIVSSILQDCKNSLNPAIRPLFKREFREWRPPGLSMPLLIWCGRVYFNSLKQRLFPSGMYILPTSQTESIGIKAWSYDCTNPLYHMTFPGHKSWHHVIKVNINHIHLIAM